MNKVINTIIWITGILVILTIVLATYSSICGNQDIGGYIAAGAIIAVCGILLLIATYHHYRNDWN